MMWLRQKKFLPLVFILALCVPPGAVRAQVGADSAANPECQPITTTKCNCGYDLNEKTGKCEAGKNKYQCICSQTDAGVVTTGTCQDGGICKAVSTGGKTPELPNPQVQPSIGGLKPGEPPGVTPATSPTLPSQQIPESPTAGPSSLPIPGQSVFQDALQQLQQLSGSGGQNSFDAAQTAIQQQMGVPSWLVDTQAQMQLTAPETAPAAAQNTYSDFPSQTGSFNPAGSGLGNFGPSPSEAAYANTLVTQTPAEQALQDVQNIGKGIADTAGGWAQGALQYLNQQSSTPTPSQNMQQDFLTTYGVCYTAGGCNSIQGAPETFSAHPDENGVMNHDIYTLDGYGRGDYPYVTVAGPRDQQGNTGVIPEITYTDPFSGQTQTLNNVPYMVADTGSSRYFPSGNSDVSMTGGNHFDVPINIPPDAYPSVTGSVAEMNSYTVAQPFNGSVASVVPTGGLQQSYALADPWSSPGSGGLPAYALQQSTTYPQSDLAWTQTVPEMSQYASLQPSQTVMSDTGAPVAENAPAALSVDSQIPTPEMVPTNPQQSFEQSIAAQVPTPEQVSSNPQQTIGQEIAAQIPVPEQVQTNPQQAIEQAIASQVPVPEQAQTNPQQSVETAVQADNAAIENALLQDRLALADVQTNAFNNPVMSPVNTSLPSGQALTQQIYDAAIAGAGENVPIPTPAEANIPTQTEMQAALLAQGQDMSAANSDSFYETVRGPEQGPTISSGSVASAPLPLSDQQVAAQIPVPEQVQTNPQQSIEATNAQEAAQASANQLAFSKDTWLSQPSGFVPGTVSGNAGPFGGIPAGEAYPAGEVTNGGPLAPAQTPTLNQEQANSFYDAVQGPVAQTPGENQNPMADVAPAERTLAAIDPYANAVTEASNGTKISSTFLDPNALSSGAGTELTSQFKSGGGDATLSENPLIPAARPPDAGPLGISLAGCGGVCEYNNTGADVKAIQQFLNTQGQDIKVDGIYGSQTEKAVESFQAANKIGVDGIVGSETLGKMNELAGQGLGTQQTPQEAPQQQAQQPTAETAQQKTETPQQPEQPAAPQKPELTPMQKEAQRVQNAFNASYGAYKAFMSNPTDQTLAKLVASAQKTQAIGSQFGDTTVQNIAAKMGNMQQAGGYNPSFVAAMMQSYQSDIISGFKAVQKTLSQYFK